MKIDLKILEKYKNDGLLNSQVHPTLDLTIWNYSTTVQYERAWDEITLMCRGLITNSKGDIVARPFTKFFNYEELAPEDIPNEPFDVSEKMDGSLGIVFFYDNQWILASRGSFTSEQAIKGNELLKKYNTKYGLYPEWTYCMEIIYPENRIVVNYGKDEKLVVLAAIETETGDEGSILEMPTEGWEIAKRYDGYIDFDEIKKMISDDSEGVVVRFKKSGKRMKIKGSEYIRLHYILTEISNRDIWALIKDNKPLDEILDRVPDEFYKWVRSQVEMFKEMFDFTNKLINVKFHENINLDMSRKEVAEIVKKMDKGYHGAMFMLYDGRDISEIIWKKIYPKVFSKPFTNKQQDDI